MPQQPDGVAPQVADRRRPPFCYQTHNALDVLRAEFAGAKRATALAVYLSLTETANREGGESARDGFNAPRSELAEAAGVSIDTFDRYIAAFVKIGLVEVVRRKVGKVNLPNTWALTEPALVPPLAADVRRGGSRTGAAQDLRREAKAEEDEANASSPLEPPKIVLIEGRNLPLDALAEECHVDPASPRLGQAVAALSGSKSRDGIRHLYWREVTRWMEEHDRQDLRDEITADEERFARGLARSIREKAERYRRAMPGAALTPTALRDWWLDLELTPERGNGGMTPAEIAAYEGPGA